MTLTPYKRKAFYYETDRMDIIHHSNYVRWLEEARVDLMEQLGCPFHEIEERGIVSLSSLLKHTINIPSVSEMSLKCAVSCQSSTAVPTSLTTRSLTLPLRKQPALPTPPTASPTPTLSL